MKTLLEVVKSKVKGDQITDDKTMIMERLIQLVAGLPSESKTRVVLTDDLIKTLWDSLDHPPMIYVGDKFKYRMADGSYNVSLHANNQFTYERLTCPEHPQPHAGCCRYKLRPVCPPKRHSAWSVTGPRSGF